MVEVLASWAINYAGKILSIEEDQECEGGEIGDERGKAGEKQKQDSRQFWVQSGYRSEVICGVGW